MLHSTHLSVNTVGSKGIPVHRSGLVHGVWWTGGPGLGSKCILVCNLVNMVNYHVFKSVQY